MEALKARLASQGSGNTHTGPGSVILAAVRTSINSIGNATLAVGRRLVGQGFQLNHAQLGLIPVSNTATSRATRRRTS